MGDVIMCDAPGHLLGAADVRTRLQRAFVLKADYPRYRLRLENGAKIWTHTGESWLTPRWAPGEFAEDQDDPFKDERLNQNLKTGSYGIHIDAQLESLRKIKEAKEFAKAVKSDDAEIPVYLCNDRIRSPDMSKETRDAALTAFRKLGHRWFMRGLVRDCTEYVVRFHGPAWTGRLRGKDGMITETGQDRLAIAGMLWHATHPNWFEFHAGSRLVHLRFPLRYRASARDGIPAWFERPGPTSREAQPVIADAGIRAKVKDKISKVVKRRYLLSTGINVKSLIKYFAVPKGEDDVRMVYDATANKLNECVWVPSFWLPTIDSLVRALDGESWMTDRDVGDMFLNFQLHRSVVPFTGVDLSSLYEGSDEVGPRWAVWDRNIRSSSQDETDGTSSIVLPCPGS